MRATLSLAFTLAACSSGTQFTLDIDAYKQPCVDNAQLTTCFRVKTEFDRDFKVSTYTIEGYDFQWGTAIHATAHIPKKFGGQPATTYVIDEFTESQVQPGATFDLIARIEDNTADQSSFTVTGDTTGHLADEQPFECATAELCADLAGLMTRMTPGTLVVHAAFGDPVSGPIQLTSVEVPR